MFFSTSFILAAIPLFARTALAQAQGQTADPATSLTLVAKVIAAGFAQDGQGTPTAGQVSSDTSTNNFINFCALHTDLLITNGAQVPEGSCNPIPMGQIPAKTKMPSGKFQNPKNGDKIVESTAFTFALKIDNFKAGNFVNATSNYFAAPQQVVGDEIQGHSHIVVELIPEFATTQVPDPTKFAFFKGLNANAVGGVLSADVTAGLPAGFYKASTITTAANHQPCLLPVAQHGSIDDVVYFEVVKAGAAGAAAAAGAVKAAAPVAAAPAAGAVKAAAPVAAAPAAGAVKGKRDAYSRSGPSGRVVRARLARELY